MDLQNDQGEALADGQYIWEVRFLPAVASAEKLRARRRDDLASVRSSTSTAPAVTTHGSFRISAGRLVSRGDKTEAVRVESPSASAGGLQTIASADQVVLDDQIVTQSLCVGQDCVNGESFGFDTIRVKENNVRINFDDTSNSASFPQNDWRIVANDSSNGGANRFSIEDATAGRTPFTILAGAPANSLFMNSAGRLGLGTATPVPGPAPRRRQFPVSAAGAVWRQWLDAPNLGRCRQRGELLRSRCDQRQSTSFSDSARHSDEHSLSRRFGKRWHWYQQPCFQIPRDGCVRLDAVPSRRNGSQQRCGSALQPGMQLRPWIQTSKHDEWRGVVHSPQLHW